METIIYRTATYYDLNNLARVHLECFPNYMISKLGKQLVAAYYKEFIEEDNLFVVAEQKSEIVGFCMGYIKGSHAREKFVANNRIKLIKKLFLLCCCFDRLAISKGFSYVVDEFKKRKSPNPVSKPREAIKQGDLLSICVRKNKRGEGCAFALVAEFETLLRKKGVTEYTLSVYSKNQRAIRFYEKCGMAVVRESAEQCWFYKKIKTQ